MNKVASTLRSRVVELREKLGLNQSAFALKVGVSQPTVSRWESGKDDPDFESLRTLAALAGCKNVDEFLGFPTLVSGVNLTVVPVIGAVEAGVWREAMEWPPDKQFYIQVPEDKRFSGLSRQALEVAGPSMNRLYPQGTYVIVVSLLEVGRDPEPGERVVCQRRNRTGQVEATIKEYVVSEGRRYLWPRSFHPDHQTPIPLEPSPENEEVRVTALVTGSYRPE
jgi:repressor LexA